MPPRRRKGPPQPSDHVGNLTDAGDSQPSSEPTGYEQPSSQPIGYPPFISQQYFPPDQVIHHRFNQHQVIHNPITVQQIIRCTHHHLIILIHLSQITIHRNQIMKNEPSGDSYLPWFESQNVPPYKIRSSPPFQATQDASQETVEPQRRKGKAAQKTKGVRGSNITPEEDEALAKAFVSVGEDLETRNQQKYAAMWCRVLEAYQQLVPDACSRPTNTMQHRWVTINKDVQRFNGIYNQLQRARRSGTTEADVLKDACSEFLQTAGHV